MTPLEEWRYLNRVYNWLVWGMIGCAWFAVVVMAYEMGAERGWWN